MVIETDPCQYLDYPTAGIWICRIVLLLPPKKQLHSIVLEILLGTEASSAPLPSTTFYGMQGWANTLPQTLILGVTTFKCASLAEEL